MLLIAVGILLLVCAVQADKVAGYYWDHQYKTEQESAANIIQVNNLSGPGVISSPGPYSQGDLIDFTVKQGRYTFSVERYQPRDIEQVYVKNAFPSKMVVVYYNPNYPGMSVLAPTMTWAKRVLGRPKPAHAPDDKVTRFIRLGCLSFGCLLLVLGVYGFRR